MNRPHEQPWLSILIPVYNVAPYLEECLASISGQLDDGVEWIALDDASTDGSRELLERLQRTSFPRLRLMSHPANQGLSAARNHLLEAASGAHVWFVDSDDIMVAGAVTALRAILTREDPDLVLCGFSTKVIRPRPCLRWRDERAQGTFRGPARRLLTGQSQLLRGAFAAGKMYAWAKIFRRSIHPTPDLFPVGRLFEDVHAMPSLFLRIRSYYSEPAPWIIYRERPGSIMRSPEPRKAEEIATSLVGLHGEFARAVAGMSRSTQAAVSIFCTHMFIGGCRELTRAEPARLELRHPEFVEILEQASPLSPAQLVPTFLLRPHLWWHAFLFASWRYRPRFAQRYLVNLRLTSGKSTSHRPSLPP